MTYRVVLGNGAASVALWITVVCSVMTLPPERFSWVWIAAFVVPAAVFYVLRWVLSLRFGWTVVLSAITHTATIVAALAIDGGIARETALGCSLLPPLTYLALRRRGDDVTWALFLSLCTFLIAVILGKPPAGQVWTFLAAGILTLQLDARARAASRRRVWTGSFGRPRVAFASLYSTLLATLAVSLLTLQLMSLIPSEEEQRREAKRRAREGTASVGLSDRFEFGPAGQRLSNLESNELVHVRGIDPPIGYEIYLRTLHFELPRLRKWEQAGPSDRPPVDDSLIVHRGRAAGLRERVIQIETTKDAGDFLFLPPGTLRVEGVGDAMGNPARENYNRSRSRPIAYTVAFQDRRRAAIGQPSEPRRGQLTALPSEFDPHLYHFEGLNDDAGAAEARRNGESPFAIAQRITNVLQQNCRYELRDPGSVVDFISSRRYGFCEHFAAALAVCLRVAGIPSRVAVGLYGSADDVVDDHLVLGSQHAHAWVEILIEGLGWVVFDPTPAAFAGAGDAELPQEGNEDDGASGTALGLWRWARESGAWLIVLLFTLAGVMTLRRRTAPTSERDRVRAMVDRDAAALFRKLMNALTKRSPRMRGQSLWDYARTLQAVDGVPVDAIENAFSAYEEVRFGQRQFDSDRRRRLEDALARMHDQPL